MGDSGFIPVRGGRLSYEADGSGPPLVLIHAGVANLRQWDPHVAAWAEGYRVIRYDTRGYGRTETERVEFANHEDVAALLDHLGESSAHVLGCSRGGTIALNFVVAHPDRARSLVFVAGGVGGYEPDVSPEAAAMSEAEWKGAEAAAEAKDFERVAEIEADYWVDGPGQPRGRAEPSIWKQVYQWVSENEAREPEYGIPQQLDPPAEASLAGLRLPVLSIVGDLEEESTLASCRHLAEVVPGAELRVVPGTAHMLNLERPLEFTGWVGDFLDRVETSRTDG